ncbi:hypothetical protein HN569_00610 [bacterium]|jgi:hypothetical protein|nr:hypothetical protein [bacterium]
MIQKTTTDSLQTSDFLTASILHYHGHTLEALDKNNPEKIIFHFLRNEKTDNVLESFHKGELSVEPQKMAGIQKHLKSRLFTDL